MLVHLDKIPKNALFWCFQKDWASGLSEIPATVTRTSQKNSSEKLVSYREVSREFVGVPMDECATLIVSPYVCTEFGKNSQDFYPGRLRGCPDFWATCVGAHRRFCGGGRTVREKSDELSRLHFCFHGGKTHLRGAWRAFRALDKRISLRSRFTSIFILFLIWYLDKKTLSI